MVSSPFSIPFFLSLLTFKKKKIGESYLALTVNTMESNLRVLDVVWDQTAGEALTCVDTKFVFPSLFPSPYVSHFFFFF